MVALRLLTQVKVRAHREVRTAPAKAAAAGCLALHCVSLLCGEHGDGDSVIGKCRQVRFVGGHQLAECSSTFCARVGS